MAYCNINGNWATNNAVETTAVRSDTGYDVTVRWKTTGKANRAKATINGSTVKKKSTTSAITLDFSGSGTKVFSRETDNKASFTDSFVVGISCGYAAGYPWASDTNVVEFTVPAIQFTVHFDAKNEGAGDPDDLTVDFGAPYGTLPVPAYANHGFDGWYLEETYETLVNSSSEVTTDEDHTLYAKWVANAVVMSFDANGGSCSQDFKTVTVESPVGELPTPVRSGYAFLGWYKADGTTLVDESYEPQDSTQFTVYAHWKPMAIMRIVQGGDVKQTNTVWAVENNEAKQVTSIWLVENGVVKQCV